MKNNRLPALAAMLTATLGTKMVGLLHLGSHERQDETAFSDVDLILLVERFSMQDFQAIRGIFRNLDYLVDVPVIHHEQLPRNPDWFQNGTHGCYFLHVLKNAEVLYGKNLFKDYPEPSEAAVRASVFRKIAEYTWAARRAFAESNRERSIYQNYQFSSRLLKMVKDVLWFAGFWDSYSFLSSQSISLLEEVNPNLLVGEEWETLKMISDSNTRNALAANMSEDFFVARMAILEKLYAYAIALY